MSPKQQAKLRAIWKQADIDYHAHLDTLSDSYPNFAEWSRDDRAKYIFDRFQLRHSHKDIPFSMLMERTDTVLTIMCKELFLKEPIHQE